MITKGEIIRTHLNKQFSRSSHGPDVCKCVCGKEIFTPVTSTEFNENEIFQKNIAEFLSIHSKCKQKKKKK